MKPPSVQDAMALAIKAHAGQTDKGGKPYIFHPMRVMQKMESNSEQIVAILHDVVEDTEITLKDLKELGYSKRIIHAINCMSKQDGEDYFDYINRVKQSTLSTTVKLADIEDNLSQSRIIGFSEVDVNKRVNKYSKAQQILLKHIETKSR